MRWISRVAISECPPRAKKSSSGTDPRHAEHVGEQLAQQLFDGVARRAARSGVEPLGAGQRLAVELAGSQHGQLVQHDERRRHHVLRQPVPHMRAQRRHQRAGVPPRRRVVGVRRRGPGWPSGAVSRAVLPPREDGLQHTSLGRPGHRHPVAGAVAEPVQVLRVDAVAAFERRASSGRIAGVEGARCRQFTGQPGVRDTGHPQPARRLGGQEAFHRTEIAERDDLLVGRFRLRRLPQDDVVAVPRQLVVRLAALHPQVDVVEAVEVPRERREEVRVEHQLALTLDRLVHRRHVGAAVAQLDGGAERAQRPEVADVAEEDRAARGQQAGRGPDDLGEVVGAREVLRDRVDDHRVERLVRQLAQVVRRAGGEMHPVGERRRGDLAPQVLDRALGKVDAPVRFGVRRDPREDQPAADADLQHPRRPQRPDALDRRRVPLPHLVERDLGAVVAGVPAGEVLLDAPAAAPVNTSSCSSCHSSTWSSSDSSSRSGSRHGVGDEPAVLGDHHRLADPRVLGEHGLDLAELDPVAADLDLVVGPAEEHQPPVRPAITRSPVRYSRSAVAEGVMTARSSWPSMRSRPPGTWPSSVAT